MQEDTSVRSLVLDHVHKVACGNHGKRLEIGLELSRRPEFGWNITMTISQGLRRWGWSDPRMQELECSARRG